MEQEFCICERSSSIYNGNEDEWGSWDISCDCEKPIEDSYEYYNHYDGEDHCNYLDPR